MGLPGSGKTTLANELIKLLPAVHWNADEVRQNINKDIGYSLEDRIENAKRLSWLASQVVKSGTCCVTDFICPIPETRLVFNADFLIYMNTIVSGRFEDTNRMFIAPDITECNYIATTFDATSHAASIFSIIKDYNVR